MLTKLANEHSSYLQASMNFTVHYYIYTSPCNMAFIFETRNELYVSSRYWHIYSAAFSALRCDIVCVYLRRQSFLIDHNH